MKRLCLLLVPCLFVLMGAKPEPRTKSSTENLKFEDAAHKALFLRARACVAGMFPDWVHHPFVQGGSFYRTKWCRGAGARKDCQIASGTAAQRDQHAVRLYTLFYGDRFPEVFGVGMQFLKTPVRAGWGVNFYLVQGGKSITGENLGVQFTRFPSSSGEENLTIHVGSGSSYKIAQSQISLPFEDVAQARARLLKDADSLRDGALAKLDKLERKVLKAIATDEIQTCDYGEYPGKGVPPPCYPRKLNEAEKKAERSRALAHFKAQKAAWRQNGKELWTVLNQAVPLPCLWPQHP